MLYAKQMSGLVFVVAMAVAALPLLAVAPLRPGPASAEPRTVAIQAAYEQQPLHFEANHGQIAAPVDFLAHGPGYTLFLTPDEAVLRLPPGPGPETRSLEQESADAGRPRLAAARSPRADSPAPVQDREVLRVQLVSGAARTPLVHRRPKR